MTHHSHELSVVVTARNDDHAGDFIRRIQLFVSGLLEQVNRFHLDSELIIVEWNPPEDRPRLRNALTWPKELGACSVRIIEVPAELHRRYQYSDKLPLFQMKAKNVGIRRALGRFVLATNVDILFASELVRFLSSESLARDSVYRTTRYDVSSDISADASIEEQLEYCSQHVIRVHGQGGTFETAKASSRLAINRSYVRIPEGLYVTWSRHLRGSRAWRSFVHLADPLAKKLGIAETRIRAPYPSLHINACGDFTMLAKESWLALRGYPELDIHSWNLDSVFLYMAHSYGLREIVLQDPMRIYHLEHAYPWPPWIPEDQPFVRERMRQLGVPLLSWAQVESWAMQMEREKRPMIFNDENWGLASETLPETVIR